MGTSKGPRKLRYASVITRQDTSQQWGISLARKPMGTKSRRFGNVIVSLTPGTAAENSNIISDSEIMTINGIKVDKWPLDKVVHIISSVNMVAMSLKSERPRTMPRKNAAIPSPTAFIRNNLPPSKAGTFAKKAFTDHQCAMFVTLTVVRHYDEDLSIEAIRNTAYPHALRECVEYIISKTGSSSKVKPMKVATIAPEDKENVMMVLPKRSCKTDFLFSAASQLKKECFTLEQRGLFEKLTMIHGFYRQEAIEAIKATSSCDLKSCIDFIQDRKFQEDIVVPEEKMAIDDIFENLFPNSVLMQQLLLDTKTKALDLCSDQKVKEALEEYLSLEAKAIRWYKESSSAYIENVATKLIQAVLSNSSETECQESSSLDCNTRDLYVGRLKEEASLLSTHLYNLPKDSNGVPIAFISSF